MKRFIGIGMVIFGLAAALTGIWNFFPPFNTIIYTPHIISSYVFGVLAVIHVCLNRKPIAQYFKKLGRRRVLVGLGFAAVAWLGIILPILVKAGILTL